MNIRIARYAAIVVSLSFAITSVVAAPSQKAQKTVDYTNSVRLLRIQRDIKNKKNLTVDEIIMDLSDEKRIGRPLPVLPKISARDVWVSPSHHSVLWEGWGNDTGSVGNKHFLQGAQISSNSSKVYRLKTIKVPASGDYLVSWSPVTEYALFLRNGGEFGPKADLYYVVDPASGTTAPVKLLAGLTPFVAFWSQSGREIVCIATGYTNKMGKAAATKEGWIFLKFQIRKESRGQIRVSEQRPITASDLTKVVGSSFLPVLRASHAPNTAYGSALSISVSPSRSSVVILDTGFQAKVPEWADPDRFIVYFGKGGRVIRRDVDGRAGNGITSAPVWSRDEQTVYFFTQEHFISLPVKKGMPIFHNRTEEFRGAFQIVSGG